MNTQIDKLKPDDDYPDTGKCSWSFTQVMSHGHVKLESHMFGKGDWLTTDHSV